VNTTLGLPLERYLQEKESMMNGLDIVRAWKDEEYRASLTEAQLAALPENPAGIVALKTAELEGAAGGNPGVGISSSRIVCQQVRTLVCPNRSHLVRACQRTEPLICARVTQQVFCPQFTVLACGLVSRACLQDDPSPQPWFAAR
jgi:mersacidin/lichenicidin family type 2 lantibiotic